MWPPVARHCCGTYWSSRGTCSTSSIQSLTLQGADLRCWRRLKAVVGHNLQQLSQRLKLIVQPDLASWTCYNMKDAAFTQRKEESIPLYLHQRSCKTVWSKNFRKRSQNAVFFSWHVAPPKCRSKGARISQALWLQLLQHLQRETCHSKKSCNFWT